MKETGLRDGIIKEGERAMTDRQTAEMIRTGEAILRRDAFMKLCRGIFGRNNLIGSDFDDFRVFEVTGRDFPQQPGGGGLHVSFSISHHALGKLSADVHEAMDHLLPERK